MMIAASYLKVDLFSQAPALMISLLFILGCNGYVSIKFNQLRKLIYSPLKDEDYTNEKALELAGDNPKWITISSIGSMFAALVMDIGKIILI